MNTPLCVNSHFVEICSNDWQSLIYQLSTFFFLFMFSKVILSFTKVCYNKKYKNLYILRTRITILSMNVLSNNSLIFMQSLSTLDAWVGSDILVTLFILTQPSWRKRLVLLDEMRTCPQCLWSPLLTQKGGATLRLLRVPRETFLNSVCIKHVLYVSTKAQ